MAEPDTSRNPATQNNTKESSFANSHPDQYRPTRLDLDVSKQILHIDWADGASTDLSLIEVRKVCPCAACRSQQEQQTRSLLPVLKTAPASVIQATGAKLVGNYALQIEWSDGHNLGIYDFRQLRQLGNR